MLKTPVPSTKADREGQKGSDLGQIASEGGIPHPFHAVFAAFFSTLLEDTLKRFAQDHGLTVGDRSMQDVVAALKSKSLVTGAQKSLLDSMPRIRDYAMHANWDKLTPQDVNSVIGYVEQFLLSKYGEDHGLEV